MFAYKIGYSRAESGPYQTKDLQALVGGFVELVGIPIDEAASRFDCYADDEGVLKRLPPNPFAKAVLRRLGFSTEDCFHREGPCGVVVLTRCSEAEEFEPLTPEDLEKINQAVGV